MSNLQDRCQSLEQANKVVVEETTAQKVRIEQLEEAIGKVNADNEQIQSACQRKIEALNADIEVERETYRKSRAGLDMIYHELQKKYEDERVSKQVTTLEILIESE